MRKISRLIIHCSASDNITDDCIDAIHRLHTSGTNERMKWGKYSTTGKGFSDVGYHFFIRKNGAIETGRPIEKVGAHVAGHNHDSIGICLSGDYEFHENQFDSLKKLVKELMERFSIEKSQVFGHRDLFAGKSCPNFEVKERAF